MSLKEKTKCLSKCRSMNAGVNKKAYSYHWEPRLTIYRLRPLERDDIQTSYVIYLEDRKLIEIKTIKVHNAFLVCINAQNMVLCKTQLLILKDLGYFVCDRQHNFSSQIYIKLSQFKYNDSKKVLLTYYLPRWYSFGEIS